jgi:hypothetical protein
MPRLSARVVGNPDTILGQVCSTGRNAAKVRDGGVSEPSRIILPSVATFFACSRASYRLHSAKLALAHGKFGEGISRELAELDA